MIFSAITIALHQKTIDDSYVVIHTHTQSENQVESFPSSAKYPFTILLKRLIDRLKNATIVFCTSIAVANIIAFLEELVNHFRGIL